MPRYGFTGTPDDTKIFILHLLSACPGPVTRDELQELAMIDDNADYFVFSDALADLTERGLVTRDAEGGLSASERAREHAEVTAADLPVSLRRQAALELEPVRKRIRRDAAIRAELEPSGDGYTARLAWSDRGAPFIELQIAAGSEEQGFRLVQGWRRHAETVYASVLAQLLDDKTDRAALSAFISPTE